MSSAFEIIAKLRAGAGDDPDNVDWLKDQEERLKKLLQSKNYALNPETQKLMAQCRTSIVEARVTLATDPRVSEEARIMLWAFIDARKWFLDLVSRDYDSELKQIESELRAQLDV